MKSFYLNQKAQFTKLKKKPSKVSKIFFYNEIFSFRKYIKTHKKSYLTKNNAFLRY